ncbi:MAG: type II toxin-antitoxin system Phd/YefM family antitoxin [Patescibacteria group bacterium]|nr:type II toxin-antitoxin system Phd/YefM family antitoxin [Patescibacteria group bacterium]
MDLKDLQDLIKKEGGKVIIVENGEPIFVIVPYEEYRSKHGSKDTVEENIPADEDELTIDDLPV